MTNYRLAPNGERSIYVEHGVWYQPDTKHIHVTVPGAEGTKGAHWSYPRTSKEYAHYRALLQEAGRWPADADVAGYPMDDGPVVVENQDSHAGGVEAGR